VTNEDWKSLEAEINSWKSLGEFSSEIRFHEINKACLFVKTFGFSAEKIFLAILEKLKDKGYSCSTLQCCQSSPRISVYSTTILTIASLAPTLTVRHAKWELLEARLKALRSPLGLFEVELKDLGAENDTLRAVVSVKTNGLDHGNIFRSLVDRIKEYGDYQFDPLSFGEVAASPQERLYSAVIYIKTFPDPERQTSSPAARPQSSPLPSDRPSIMDLVIQDMRDRNGTPLQAHNWRDAMMGAYQEALDLCCHLRQIIEENKCI
jgi:hypothetical protein